MALVITTLGTDTDGPTGLQDLLLVHGVLHRRPQGCHSEVAGLAGSLARLGIGTGYPRVLSSMSLLKD